MTKDKINKEFFLKKDLESIEKLQNIYEHFIEEYSSFTSGLSVKANLKDLNNISSNYLKIVDTKYKIIGEK